MRNAERDRLIVLVLAGGAYLLALIGAVGFAIILRLDLMGTVLLVAVVAVAALWGSAIPIARLVSARLKERREQMGR